MNLFILLVEYPWVCMNPLLASSVSYHIVYWLVVFTAIYMSICFGVYYQDAKRRGVTTEHTVHWAFSLLLWFWVFKFDTLLFLLPGILVSSITYPLVFFNIDKKYIEKYEKSNWLFLGAIALFLFLTYWFLGEWAWATFDYKITRTIMKLLFTFVNVCLLAALGRPLSTCPKCHYYCATKKIKDVHLGTSYDTQSVTRTQDRYLYTYESTDKITDHYVREKFRTTDYYQVDHHRITYQCPHCNYVYTLDSASKNLIKTIRKRL